MADFWRGRTGKSEFAQTLARTPSISYDRDGAGGGETLWANAERNSRMSGTQLLLKVRYRLAINYVVWVSAEHKRTELAWGDILEYCLNPTPGARLPGNLTGSVSDRFHPKFNNVLDSRETGRDWKPKTFDRWLAHERFVDILQDCSLSTTKPFSKRPPFDRAKSLVCLATYKFARVRDKGWGPVEKNLQSVRQFVRDMRSNWAEFWRGISSFSDSWSQSCRFPPVFSKKTRHQPWQSWAWFPVITRVITNKTARGPFGFLRMVCGIHEKSGAFLRLGNDISTLRLTQQHPVHLKHISGTWTLTLWFWNYCLWKSIVVKNNRTKAARQLFIGVMR